MTRLLALLRQVPTTAYLIAGLLTAAGGWFAMNNAHQRALGAERILTAQARASGDTARAEVKRLSKVLPPQIAAAGKTRIKWDTVKAGIDTAWLHDTIPVPVEVVRTVVLSADTAIKACTEALNTCQALVGAQRRRAEAAETDAKLAWRQVPSKLSPWLRRGEGAAVVLVVLKVAGLLK
jgi:hypothetical protein